MSHRILVVEDEVEIAGYLRRGLSFEGYTVEVAPDGRAALDLVREQPPDLVVLDLMLPGIDGLEVARRLRASGLDLRIIMLTARDAVADRVTGLESGADDYLPKPFAFEELLARIRAQLRQRQQKPNEHLSIGGLTMDVQAHQVHSGQHVVELTAKEFEVLEFFLRHPHHVLTREVLYNNIWGYDFGNDSNVIEVYIRALRQKLEANGAPRLLHTVRGVGYVLRQEG